VVATLSALAAIPEAARGPLVRQRLAEAIAYLRIHRGYLRSTEDRPLFRHLQQYFLFGAWRMHLLDVLESLSEADPGLVEEDWLLAALQAVTRSAPDGRVRLAKNYKTKLEDPLAFEPLGKPSRFLSLQWLRTRRRFGAELVGSGCHHCSPRL